MISSKFGRFLIKRWLGGGRFADVYLVEDPLLGKEFALKIARGKGKELQGLMDEVKLLAELLHPNIVRFFSVEKEGERVGIVLEYIEGRTLREVIKEEAPLSLGKVLKLVKQMGEAIDYAHGKGILHRDLKPENIMIAEDQVKITDFGLAFFMEGEMTRSVAGTPPYMAPETWKGKYYPESDIFSLGVITYELLTGVNPFFSDNIEDTMKKIRRGIPPRAIPPNLGEGIKAAILKATAKKPQERFSSASEFLGALLEDKASGEVILLKGKPRARETRLSKEQEEASHSPFRYTLVVGGPGTGKTQTLIERVSFLLEKGVAPEGILLTTFTNKGREDLQERIARHHRDVVDSLWIGTLHQICTRILEANLELINYPNGFTIVPPRVAEAKLSKVLKDLGIKYPAYQMQALLSNAISSLTPIQEMRMGEEKKKALKKAMEAYAQEKQREGIMDYDDVLLYTYRLLHENSLVREDYQEFITDIIVDEFQDLNPIQLSIIRMLLGKRGRLFATGDDDQSIYEWRGGKPQFIRDFKRIFPEDSKVYTLTRSFRLGQGILNPAMNLISNNKRRLPKVVWSEKEHGEMTVEKFPDRGKEVEFVASEIMKEAMRGRSFNEFAILARYNYLLRGYVNALAHHNIPYSIMFAKNLIEKREITLLVKFLKLLKKPNRSAFLFFVNLRERLVSKEELKGKRNYMDFLLNHENPKVRERAGFLKSLIEGGKNLSPSGALRIAVKYTGLLEGGTPQSKLIRSETIGEFLDLARDFEERNPKASIESFLQYLKMLEGQGILKAQEGVKVLSAHASKGLQFPVVFIVDAYEGAFPAFTRNMSQARLEEERRLFYVAMTRATEKLYIIYPEKEGKTQVEPSRFVKEVLGVTSLF